MHPRPEYQSKASQASLPSLGTERLKEVCLGSDDEMDTHLIA
jgi:hypothetical protein